MLMDGPFLEISSCPQSVIIIMQEVLILYLFANGNGFVRR
jgi:hypothetical protein